MSFTARIDADASGFEQGVNQATESIQKLQTTVEQKLTSIGKKFESIGKKASIFSAAIVAVGAKAFSMAADFEDALGATDQVFKESSEAIKDWANNLGSQYGVAKKEALEYANLMGTMLKNIGQLTEDQASRQSQALVELAGDLTAMFGGSTQEAVTALTASLRGNNIALTRYGVAINDALIKNKALEMGLVHGTNEMSLQAKQAATLALIWEQTGASQGQAAREADSASGAMRALKTEVSNLTTELGERLLTTITPIINKIRDVVSAIRDMSPEMQKMTVALAGIAAAFGPLMLITGKIIAMLPMLSAGLAALTSPIGLVVAAVVAGAALIISNWDNIVEYFTVGAGAEVFNTVKEIAQELWDFLKFIWNGLTNDIMLIWEKFGKYITNSFKLTFDNLIRIVKIPLDLILGVVKTFSKILQGDWKGAWEAIKTMTFNIMSGVSQILNNILAGMANAVAGFFEFLGAEKWAAKISEFAQKLAPVLEPKTIPIQIHIPDETKSAVKELTEDLKELSAETAKLERMPTNITIPSIAAGNLTGLTTTAIDPLRGLSMTEYIEKYKQAAEEIKMITFDMKEYMVDAFTDMWMSIGDALVNGKNVLKSIGSSLLGSLGRVMVDLGKMVLMSGEAIVAVKAALTSLSGPVAIAAGAALIAVGSIFAAGASKLGNSMGSGGGMGGSSSVAGMQTTVTPVTPSYRGSYFDGSEVTFKIGTNELVGVLAMADNRKNRL